MRIKAGRGARLSLLLLSLGGALGGFVNGLLGAGGGIIITLTLSRLLPSDEEGRRSVYASSLCVTLPLSLLTLFIYLSSSDGALSSLGGGEAGTISLSPEAMMIAAALGGVVGAILLGRLKSRLLSGIFAALCTISGILMMI